MTYRLSRRSFVALVASSIVSTACTQTPKPNLEDELGAPENKLEKPALVETTNTPQDGYDQPDYAKIYAAVEDGDHSVPAIPYNKIDPQFLRQEVAFETVEPVYSVIVDTEKRFLYWILPEGQAIRYGVGLGAQGRTWKGRAVIHYKRKWPRWIPTEDMIARSPKLKIYGVESGGMPPGIHNPMAGRAMYIFQDGKDTFYRIHGNPQWESIGKNASAGCVRMLIQDSFDLYDRIKGHTPLLVI